MELRPAHGLHGQALEHAVVRARDGDPAPVSRAIVIVRHHVFRARADALADLAEGGVQGDHLVEHPQHGLVERHVDHLAEPRAMAALDGGERAEGAHHARQVVGNRWRSRRDGRAIRVSRDVADAAHRARDATESRPPAARARLTEGRDPHHDQSRVRRGQRVVSEVPLLHGPRPEVLGEDVGAGGQPRDERLALGLAQVARDRFLVPALDQPHVRDPRGRLVTEPSQIVADAGLLDLDHVGAQLAQQRAAEGRSHVGRQVQSHEAVERSAQTDRLRCCIARPDPSLGGARRAGWPRGRDRAPWIDRSPSARRRSGPCLG